MATITEALRRAVESSGQTRYAIARATGIPESTLSRFVVESKGLRSENIDKLCAQLGLVLTARTPRKGGRK